MKIFIGLFFLSFNTKGMEVEKALKIIKEYGEVFKRELTKEDILGKRKLTLAFRVNSYIKLRDSLLFPGEVVCKEYHIKGEVLKDIEKNGKEGFVTFVNMLKKEYSSEDEFAWPFFKALAIENLENKLKKIEIKHNQSSKSLKGFNNLALACTTIVWLMEMHEGKSLKNSIGAKCLGSLAGILLLPKIKSYLWSNHNIDDLAAIEEIKQKIEFLKKISK